MLPKMPVVKVLLVWSCVLIGTITGEVCRTLLSAIIGATVQRGPDWKWGNQDGGAGERGITIRADGEGRVRVQWSHGLEGSYRIGQDGSYDLCIIHEAVPCESFLISDVCQSDRCTWTASTCQTSTLVLTTTTAIPACGHIGDNWYEDSSGNMFRVQQTGCVVSLVFKGSAISGALNGHTLTMAGLADGTVQVEGDVRFVDGGMWTKFGTTDSRKFTATVAPYSLMPLNTNECPHETPGIREAATCQAAADAFNLVYRGSENEDFVPKGCYLWRYDHSLYFNEHTVGAAFENGAPICQAARLPIGMPLSAPAPAPSPGGKLVSTEGSCSIAAPNGTCSDFHVCDEGVCKAICNVDDSSRRRAGKTCLEFANEPVTSCGGNTCCSIAKLSRRRAWGGEAYETCQSSCASFIECKVCGASRESPKASWTLWDSAFLESDRPRFKDVDGMYWVMQADGTYRRHADNDPNPLALCAGWIESEDGSARSHAERLADHPLAGASKKDKSGYNPQRPKNCDKMVREFPNWCNSDSFLQECYHACTGSDFRIVPGRGWCQTANRSEGTARKYVDDISSCDSVRAICQADSRCVAFACKSSSNRAVVYTSTGCTSQCEDISWLTNPGVIAKAGYLKTEPSWKTAYCYVKSEESGEEGGEESRQIQGGERLRVVGQIQGGKAKTLPFKKDFEPVAETYKGYPTWQRMGDANVRIVRFSQNRRWYVTTADRMSSGKPGGFLASAESTSDHPLDVTLWRVWTGSNWEKQPSLAMRQVCKIDSDCRGGLVCLQPYCKRAPRRRSQGLRRRLDKTQRKDVNTAKQGEIAEENEVTPKPSIQFLAAKSMFLLTRLPVAT